MLDNFPALFTFAEIVSHGSLSAAARHLDLPLSVVSKRLTQLEATVGVRLLLRTTRRQVLTEEGTLFHEQVLRIIDEIAQAETLLQSRRNDVSGSLRVTAPGQLGRAWIVPIVSRFQHLHPDVTVELHLSDAVADLLDGGWDLAVRFGELPDSSLVARTLAPNFRVLCASSDYLERAGVPKTPSDLTGHACILIGRQRRVEWQFIADEPTSIRVTARVLTNDGEAAHRFALAGAGIAVKSIWDVGDDLRAGRLRRVLPGYKLAAAPLHAILPHGRLLVPRVRVFAEFLRESLTSVRSWGDG
ncbi:LysR family transcriptional regulator [Burkholderia pyrrocinia]|uniref:LysR family transcriptional regulator n=1 Tax=Burkholderia pyrrocinia TaxID=60550 RepID=UPI000A3DF251|nr:LysR family transcriptional regulator [Burkholderia pyrrocinia]